jgi:hypothetical protein
MCTILTDGTISGFMCLIRSVGWFSIHQILGKEENKMVLPARSSVVAMLIVMGLMGGMYSSSARGQNHHYDHEHEGYNCQICEQRREAKARSQQQHEQQENRSSENERRDVKALAREVIAQAKEEVNLLRGVADDADRNAQTYREQAVELANERVELVDLLSEAQSMLDSRSGYLAAAKKVRQYRAAIQQVQKDEAKILGAAEKLEARARYCRSLANQTERLIEIQEAQLGD